MLWWTGLWLFSRQLISWISMDVVFWSFWMQDRAIYYIFTDWKGMDKEEMLKIQLSRDQQVAAQWQIKKKEFPPSQLPHLCGRVWHKKNRNDNFRIPKWLNALFQVSNYKFIYPLSHFSNQFNVQGVHSILGISLIFCDFS